MASWEAPPWLRTTFVRALTDVGSTADEAAISAEFEDLSKRWSEPERHHHNLKHLAGVLTRVNALAEETHNVDVVTLAAYYHGIIFSTAEKDTYRRHGGENERASATYAYGKLARLGVAPETCQAVSSLITGLKLRREDLDMSDTDLLALRDAHMGSLAAEPQRYVKYLDEISEEYSHIPTKDFLLARRDILSKLLARKNLFLSPLGMKWETDARQNLTAEIERIDVKLSTYTEEPGDMLGPEPAPRALTPDEYRQAKDLPNERTPVYTDPLADTGDMSTLESMPDEGAGITSEESAEEKRRRAERADIERRLKQRMAERTGVIPAVTIPMAATPEWVDDDEIVDEEDDDSSSSSIEKEPEN